MKGRRTPPPLPASPASDGSYPRIDYRYALAVARAHPGEFVIEWWHDLDCPTGRTQNMADCCCRPDAVMRRVRTEVTA